MAEETAFEKFIAQKPRSSAKATTSPKSIDDPRTKKTLSKHMADAMGPVPEKPCDLEPRVLGTSSAKDTR